MFFNWTAQGLRIPCKLTEEKSSRWNIKRLLPMYTYAQYSQP